MSSSTNFRLAPTLCARRGMLTAALFVLIFGGSAALAQEAADQDPDAGAGLRGGLAEPAAAPDADGLTNPDTATPATGSATGPGTGTSGSGVVSGDAVSNPDGTQPAPAEPAAPRKFALPKTKAKTQDRARIPRLGAPRLPDLKSYPTAVRLKGGPLIEPPLDGSLTPSPTVAALPIEPRLRPRFNEDGFEPIGINVGSLRLTPYVEQSFGYDSNPDQIQTGVKPSPFSRTEGGFGLISQWSSNELRADMRGGYDDYFRDRGANRPDGSGTVDLRIDAARDTVIDAEQRFTIDTQRPGSPELNVTAVGRPLITTLGGTLGVTQTFGRFELGLHGIIDRTEYENAQLSDGSIQDLADENYNDFGVHLRGTYEVTPVLKPFADILVDRREHDDTIDISGFRRSSDGVIGQLGSSFELGRLISGEASAGYGERSYDDPRLRSINGPVVNAKIAYAITPLTTFALHAATTFDETNFLGASGSEGRSVGLDVTHQLLRNLTLTASLSYLNTQYVGAPITENTLSETLKAEYRLSRWLVATGSYNHETLHSTAAGSSYDQNVVLFGLKVQR